jgi:DUF4097 and DUF4098 domain-containing protein YvlB
MARARALGLLAVSIGLPAAGIEASLRERFERTVDFSRGGIFSIESPYGAVEIEVGSEGSVRVEAEKEAESEEALRDLEIAIEGSGDRVSVRTVHHQGGAPGTVSYRIFLPAEAQVHVSTGNGDVSIRGIHGRIEVHSVNGALAIEGVAGAVVAETINGDIRASYTSPVEDRHHFETTNGAVRIHLPTDAGGEINAVTTNGSIDVEFPMNLTGTGTSHVQGTFGNGSSRFEISTVNGSVSILSN